MQMMLPSKEEVQEWSNALAACQGETIVTKTGYKNYSSVSEIVRFWWNWPWKTTN